MDCRSLWAFKFERRMPCLCGKKSRCQHNVHQMKCHTDIYSSDGQIRKGEANRNRSNSPWLKGYSKGWKSFVNLMTFSMTQDIFTTTSLVFRIMCGDGKSTPLLRYFGALRPPLRTQLPQNGRHSHLCKRETVESDTNE